MLIPGTRTGYRSRVAAFREELKRLGYIEGQDIAVEIRWADARADRLPLLAAELVSLNPDVIVTSTSAALSACRKVTSTIPTIFATAANPVEQGFVASLQRPGGNITGIMVHLDLVAKVVEIAREALPRSQRLAILIYDQDPVYKPILDLFMRSVVRFKFEPIVVRTTRPGEFDRVFRELSDRKADALYLPDMAFTTSHSDELIAHSLRARLPLLSGHHDTTRAGGLLSYGTEREESFRRAAALVDKILRGAKPAELPVEQPERFQLIVNRKTAKAIGVTLSSATLQRADRVIE